MSKKDIFLGLTISLVIALFMSPFASPWPDGLERVAKDKGFLEKGEGSPAIAAPIADYAFPGIENKEWATSIAGFVGTLAMFGVGWGVAVLIKKKRK